MDFVRASESAVSGSYCHFQGITNFTQTQVACESFSLGEKSGNSRLTWLATCPTDWGKTTTTKKKQHSFKFENTLNYNPFVERMHSSEKQEVFKIKSEKCLLDWFTWWRPWYLSSSLGHAGSRPSGSEMWGSVALCKRGATPLGLWARRCYWHTSSWWQGPGKRCPCLGAPASAPCTRK